MYNSRHSKFVATYGKVKGCDPEDLGIVAQGPDHPDYWDAWDCILRDARLVDRHGQVYCLEQDGDLWAVTIDD